MIRQEKKRVNQGGINADDMGLGKVGKRDHLLTQCRTDQQTVQAIATVVLNPSEDPERRVTLVVVTQGLLKQWQDEIVNKSSLCPFVYHGAGREHNARAMLSKADIILTTYAVLAREVSKEPRVSTAG